MFKSSSSALLFPKRQFSQVDQKFTEILSNEIKQEKEHLFINNPPKGFSVTKREGPEIVLRKEYSDGV